VQFEFELKDNTNMDKRMLEYIGILHKNTNKPVLQFVVYLGKGKAKMNNSIKFGQLDFAFNVVSIEDFDYKEFLDSPYPEEVLLSLLAFHEDISDEELLKLILQRFIQLKGKSLATKKFTNQLVMLSRVRNLQNTVIKIVKNMNDIGFDINSDILYLEGVETGFEKGVVKGIEEGIEKGSERGRLKQSIISILNMTEENIPQKTIAKFLALKIPFVNSIQKQFLVKDKLEKSLKTSKKEDLEVIAKKFKVHPILAEILRENLTKKKAKKA